MLSALSVVGGQWGYCSVNVRNTAILCYIEFPHIFADNSCNVILHTFRTEVTNHVDSVLCRELPVF